MPSTISISGVSLELSNGRNLFENISFSLNLKLTALVGPNGIGKSCLAKLIVGDLSPTVGTVRKSGAVTFLPQRGIPQPISVEDYLAFRYSWTVFGEKLLTGINRATLCSNLSGGQWMRVRLASTIDDQFLILDEPTNDLDLEAKTILKDFLAEYQHGVLLISHDRELLALCDAVLELSNQGLKKYGGGWQSYEKEKERERNQSLAELDRAKRERTKAKAERAIKIERQEKRNRRGIESAEKGGMPKILIGARKRQAQATTGRVDASTMERTSAMVHEAYEAFKVLKNEPIMYAGLVGLEVPSQKLVAEARNYNVLFDRWLYARDLNFSWRGNIRLALKGANGSGKTTLIKALLGNSLESKGELRLGNLATLYLDQQCSMLNDSLSVIENVRAVSKMSESEIRSGLAKLLFTGDSVFQGVHSLSGGERLRTALACGLLAEEKPELIILDEPTNNLDLGNIRFLENLISQFEGAVIIISHDEVFLKECGIAMELFL